MVNKAAIDRNLHELSARYERRSRNPRDPLYFSKLALIELCGWIEETMDNIARDCARRHSTAEANLAQVAEEVIGRTYGFHYGDHFRNMLMGIVGLVKIEELEGMLDPAKFNGMKSSLGILREKRNSEAHTYIKGITQTVDAPSVTTRHFQNVYEGLKDMEQCIRRLSI